MSVGAERGDVRLFLIMRALNDNQILKDRKGILWFATQYGLNVLTPDWEKPYVGKEDGFPAYFECR